MSYQSDIKQPQQALLTDVSDARPMKRNTFFCFSVFLLLLVEFTLNPFGVADEYWFRTHQTDSEGLVVARMVPTSDGNFFAVGGFFRMLDGDFNTNAPKIFDYYYFEDVASLPASRFEPYTGQVGLHGHIFAAADLAMRAAGLNGRQRFTLLRTVVASATAAILAYLVLLIKLEFGLQGALTALAMLVFSPWLTAMAKNIYWLIFCWFPPMALAWRAYVTSEPPIGKGLRSLAILIGATLTLKCLCGFEYITSIGGATVSIAAYGLIKKGAGWRRMITHVSILMGAMACGVLSALLIHVSVLGMYLGSFNAAVIDFIQRVHVHTSIGDRLYEHRSVSEAYVNALQTSYLDTLLTYVNDAPIFSVASDFSLNALYLLTPLTVFILTIGAILLSRFRNDPFRQREALALLTLAAGTAISSMSWFVFAHGHSSIHTHVNYVLWHVPYAFLVCPICIRLAQISTQK